jgi:hypothetical protein
MYNMQKIWVLCTRCGSGSRNAFFGATSIGSGSECPSCGSDWKEGQIIASTLSKSSSEILGDIRLEGKKSNVKVIWLET